MSVFSFIDYETDTETFLKQLVTMSAFDLPTSRQFKLLSNYRKEELGSTFKDLSFCVLREDIVDAVILTHKVGDVMSFSSMGGQIYRKTDDKKLLTAIIDYILVLGEKNSCKEVRIADQNLGHHLSSLGQELFNRRGVPNTKLIALQDLSKSHLKLHSDIRKSYKNLINKSRDSIDIKFITSENVNRSVFSSFKNFHREVAGRQTRPDESWDVQFEMIKSGCAELILGFMDSHGLVSSALFTDYGPTTSYAVAVYNRDLFEYPLAHANVYEGMLRAKARGQKIFDLGVIPTYNPQNGKEYNIGKFKKGFCSVLSTSIEWSLPVS